MPHIPSHSRHLVRPRRARAGAARPCALALLACCAPVARVRAHEPEAPPAPDRDEAGRPYQTEVVAAPDPLARSAASEVSLARAELDLAPRRSAEDLLRLVPGVLLLQHGAEGKGHQLFLRGFDAEHGADVEATLHGLPLNQPSNVHGHGYLDLAFLPAEVVDGIDVVKGPFEAAQGDFATAGSLRLRVGVPAQRRGLWTRYQAGSTNRHRGSLVFAPAGRHARSFAAGEALHDDGFGQRRGARRASLLASAHLRDLDERGGEVELLAGVHAADFELPGAVRWQAVQSGALGFHDVHDDRQGGRARQALALATHRVRAGDGLWTNSLGVVARTLALRENFTGHLEDPVAGDARRQRDAHLRLRASTALLLPLFPALALSAGASWQALWLAQDEVRIDAAGTPRARVRDLTARQQHGALHAELAWRPSEALQVTGGGRADLLHFAPVDGLTGAGVAPGVAPALALLSPRVHAGLRPCAALALLAAYGHGLRSPEARAFTRPQVPPADVPAPRSRASEPRVTASRTAELGAVLAPDPRWSVTLAGFHTRIARESIYDHVAGTNLQRNATRRVGVEAAVTVTPWAPLTLRADATLVDARFEASGAPVPAAPRRILSVLALWQHPRGYFGSVRAYHVGPRPVLLGGQAQGFTILSALAGWRHGRWELTVEADNVLDQRFAEGQYQFASYWPGAGLPGPDRTPALHAIAGPPLLLRAGLGLRF